MAIYKDVIQNKVSALFFILVQSKNWQGMLAKYEIIRPGLDSARRAQPDRTGPAKNFSSSLARPAFGPVQLTSPTIIQCTVYSTQYKMYDI